MIATEAITRYNRTPVLNTQTLHIGVMTQMAKATDIAGTIRIPEAGYGRFWNFMRSMPGAEFTPVLEAKSEPVKKPRAKGKDSEGSSSKCIMLGALVEHDEPMTTAQIVDTLVKAGRSRHVGSLIDRLIKEKLITRTKAGYKITAAGEKFHDTSCPRE